MGFPLSSPGQKWTLGSSSPTSYRGTSRCASVGTPVERICKTEQIQCWATKYILNVPFLCVESYKDRLIKLDLLAVSYWQEYLDIVFFFKSVTGLVIKVNPTVIPTRRGNTNVTLFVPKKYTTTTYQRSFFTPIVRIWNALADDIGLSKTISLSLFKAHLLSYYK